MITLVCYYAVVAFFAAIGFDHNTRVNDFHKIDTGKNQVANIKKDPDGFEYRSGMDPTPLPNFPPTLEVDTELLD